MSECIECQRLTHCTYDVCDNCMTEISKLRAEIKDLMDRDFTAIDNLQAEVERLEESQHRDLTCGKSLLKMNRDLQARVEELQSAQDIIEYVLLHGETHSEIGQMLEEMVSEHKAKAEGGEV
jgi:hypothetical protein